MLRLYLTRLLLPLLFVAGMVAVPFLWLPEVETPASRAREDASKVRKARRATPFQRAMTIGFALILVSVSAGGFMLYRITRAQTASWRRRFAPSPRRRKRP